MNPQNGVQLFKDRLVWTELLFDSLLQHPRLLFRIGCWTPTRLGPLAAKRSSTISIIRGIALF